MIPQLEICLQKERALIKNIDDLYENFNFNYETGIITNKITRSHNAKKGAESGTSKGKDCYRNIMFRRVRYLSHRLIWIAYYKKIPEGEMDHINGIKNDNKITNLRVVTRTENMQNKRANNDSKSRVLGVYFNKANNKWTASIGVNRKHIHLGHYKDLRIAEYIRKKAEREYGFHENHGKKLIYKNNNEWDIEYKCCIECLTTKIPHNGFGLCLECFYIKFEKAKKHKRWTKEEDDEILRSTAKDIEIAEILNRSTCSIRTRRSKFLHEQKEKRWSNDEIQLLRLNTDLSFKELSKKINRTIGSIKTKHCRLRLTKEYPKRYKWTKFEIKLLKITQSNIELSKKIKRSIAAINRQRFRIKCQQNKEI